MQTAREVIELYLDECGEFDAGPTADGLLRAIEEAGFMVLEVSSRITFPPEMLPRADGEEAEVVVVAPQKN